MMAIGSRAAVAVECFGPVVQGTLGFDVILIAVPLLVLINSWFAPGAVVLAGGMGALLVVARERSGADWRTIRWALGGRLPGNAIGIAVVAMVASKFTQVTVGALVIVGIVVSASGLRARRTTWTTMEVGAGPPCWWSRVFNYRQFRSGSASVVTVGGLQRRSGSMFLRFGRPAWRW